MYNVKEAYVLTLKSGSSEYEKCLKAVKNDINKAIKLGDFKTSIQFLTVTSQTSNRYTPESVYRVRDYLIYLGYDVNTTELTNDVIRLDICWAEEIASKYQVDNS